MIMFSTGSPGKLMSQGINHHNKALYKVLVQLIAAAIKMDSNRP
jgi:hypothetical protein